MLRGVALPHHPFVGVSGLRGNEPPNQWDERAATRNQQIPGAIAFAFLLERVMGIEPTSKAWEAFVLPLNYTRKCTNLHRFYRQHTV